MKIKLVRKGKLHHFDTPDELFEYLKKKTKDKNFVKKIKKGIDDMPTNKEIWISSEKEHHRNPMILTISEKYPTT